MKPIKWLKCYPQEGVCEAGVLWSFWRADDPMEHVYCCQAHLFDWLNTDGSIVMVRRIDTENGVFVRDFGKSLED